MSGDVQPRKRKDKKRKKVLADRDYHIQRIRGSSFDEDDSGTPPPTLVNPSEISTDRVTIHVHKEGGTGGHWCARIIFFTLLSVLAGLIGLIIFEHRGSTDVDTPITDSRWAMIFDGWVDDSIPQHDEEPHEEASEENDEHDDEETEEDEKDHEEEDEAEEEEEEGDEEDNVDSPEVEKEEDEGIGSDEEEEEEEEKDGSEHDEDEDDEGQQSDEEDVIQQNERKLGREKRSEEDENASKNEIDENNDDEGFDEENSAENDDDFDALEELENVSDEDNDENELEDEGPEEDEEERKQEEEEKEADNVSSDNDLDVSIEGVKDSGENEEDNISQEYFSIPGVGEIDDNSAEPLEEIEDGDIEEIVNEFETEQPDEEHEVEEESASVAVKFGVGVALIVAAHFVLVRRWNNVDADLAAPYSSEVVDLSRRNTIVPPLNPKDLITTNETEDRATIEDDKITETYEELKSKYKNLESSPKSRRIEENLQTQNFSMQEKSLKDTSTLPKAETRRRNREEEMDELLTSESERQSATEPEEEEEEEEEEEDDEPASEEAGEEDEEEDDEDLEDEEVEEPDDSELVAKLEAKYGKLPTPTESEDEEDYEDEEEEEEDEEDEEIRGWKRVRSPKGPQSVGPKVEHGRDVRGKDQAPKTGSASSQSGGKSIQESVNDSSYDEVTIQEEMTSWITKEFDN